MHSTIYNHCVGVTSSMLVFSIHQRDRWSHGNHPTSDNTACLSFGCQGYSYKSETACQTSLNTSTRYTSTHHSSAAILQIMNSFIFLKLPKVKITKADIINQRCLFGPMHRQLFDIGSVGIYKARPRAFRIHSDPLQPSASASSEAPARGF